MFRSGSRHRCRLSKWKLIFQMSCTKVRCLTAIRFTADQLTTNTKQSPSMPRRIFLRPRSRRTCLATSRFSMYLKKRYSDVLWITAHVHTQPVISKHTSQQQFYTLPHIYINPLMGTLILHSNGPLYSNTVILHWPLMGGLLQLVQRGGAWVGCGPTQTPPRCTKFFYKNVPIIWCGTVITCAH